MSPATNRPKPTRRMPVGAVALIGTLAALAVPAVATATTDRWVDAETGSNAGGNGCTVQASPCATIVQASNASQSEGNAGTIHVDQGTYTGTVNLAQTNALAADDFVPGDSGPTTIDGGSTVAIFAQANSSVTGFEITSTSSAAVALLSDNAVLDGNTITAKGANSIAVEVNSAAGTPAVTGNTIVADNGDEGTGIRVDQNASPATITDNQIGSATIGFDRGVEVRLNAGATIAHNRIQGLDQFSGVNARGISVVGGTDVTISDNTIDSPSHALNNETDGVYVDGVDGSVALHHNTIVGMTGFGVVFIDGAGTFSLDGDAIARSSDAGVYMGAADLTIRNATIVDNGPLVADSGTLAIDSSILDDPIDASNGATCDLTYSRGPAIVEGGSGCGEFQTTANPRFVDQFGTTPDLHLQATSPLIDAGNPAAPAAGATDIDGDDRALEGDGACPIDAERDMGYDEVVAAIPVCQVPPPADETAPQTTVAGKVKQFGKRAKFTLASSEPNSTFECRLDKGQFVPCGADLKTRKLNAGRHTVFARATDAAGNTDPTPMALKFKLKRPRS
jgi:hypothetical protein